VTPGELDDAVQAAAAVAVAALGGGLAGAGDAVGRAGVRRPRHPEQGDYASPVALRLAQETGLPAGELARAIAIGLGRHPGVRRAEAAGPGFVSIWLTARASGDLAGLIVADGQAYGRSDRLAGQRFRLDPPPEDPSLTATLSQARRGALAAATGRMLRAAGARLSAASGSGVTSLRIPGPAATRTSAPGPRAAGRPAAQGLQEAPVIQTPPATESSVTPSAPASPPAGPGDAQDPHVTFRAPTTSTTSLSPAGPPATQGLQVTSGGQGTSVAGVSPAGLAPDTLGQLMAAVGAGAAWYALVSWPPGVPAEIDLAVWARRTSVSPAWVVHHARQRITGLGGRAATGISLESGFDPARLTAREETALLSLLADFPAVVAVAGRAGEPHRVARYLESVAAAWSACDEACPVLPRRGPPAPDLARARLTLAQAAGTVLASGLSLLGVPD
jgi:hypothetical protein